MASLPAHLVELREIFRDEVRDLLDALERALAVAGSHAHPEAERRSAITECFRVIHSLKGAARAVDLAAVERVLHVAETKISTARSGSLEIVDELSRSGSIVLEALRRMQPALDRGEAPDDVHAERALAQLREERTSISEATRAPASEPASAPASEPASAPASEPIPTSLAQPAVDDARERPVDARGETVRVASSRLDALVSAAEELLGVSARIEVDSRGAGADATLIDIRSELALIRAQLRSTATVADARAMIDRSLVSVQTALLRSRESRERLHDDATILRATVGRLVERGRALRLAKLASLGPLLQRIAGETARALGREIDLELELDAPEVDRRVVESLREPLGHVLRNAIDHGLEPAEVRRRAGKPARGKLRVVGLVRGRDVEISVEDDGRGLDAGALRRAADRAGHTLTSGEDVTRLAFLPGITTREEATEVSGRGMGLDVVRQRVAELHGRVEVTSTPGLGARFTLVVPLDLSILHVLVARVRDVTIAIVTTSIERVIRITPAQETSVGDRTYLQLDDVLAEPGGEQTARAPVPLTDLAEVLGVANRPGAATSEGATPCVVLVVGERRLAAKVDALIDEREIVARPLGVRVRRAPYVSAAAILAEGEVALVLDTADLVRTARPATRSERAEPKRVPRVLVVDDSVTTRQLERSILEAAGYEVVLAADGQAAWDILSTGTQRFDAVVSDIEMPRMDGFALVTRIRATATLARLPIILVTALAQDDDRRRALDLGASAYIVKGRFDQEELIETLESVR